MLKLTAIVVTVKVCKQTKTVIRIIRLLHI